MRLMVPGPFRWVLETDLQQLSESYGQSRSFPRLRSMVHASQLRAFLYEDANQGGLHIGSRMRELRYWIRNSDYINRYSTWYDWFENGPVSTLHRNEEELRAKGIRCSQVCEELRDRSYLDEDRIQRRIKITFQKEVRLRIDKLGKVCAEDRMRHKLERWNLSGLPRVTAGRCITALRILKSSSTPWVCAAALRTMWNGWPTARRFQGYQPCLYLCGGFFSEDSIEHYSTCPTAIRFGRSFLNIRFNPQPTPIGNLATLGLNCSTLSDQEIINRGTYCYALYRTLCALEHTAATSKEEVHDMLCQYARQALNDDESCHPCNSAVEFGD